MNYKLIPLPEFERQVKRLRKKYRHIKDDLLNLRQELLDNPEVGEAIVGLNKKVYKLRLASTDLKRGKSGSFRIIYYFDQPDLAIYLLTIYPKPEKENFQVNDIVEVLKHYGLWQ